MSGGSYDNLFLKDAEEIVREVCIEVLRAMANRLSDLGYARDAARETEKLVSLVNQFKIEADAHIENLKEVWQAVEKLDSNDSDEEALKTALNNYTPEQLQEVQSSDQSAEVVFRFPNVAMRNAFIGGLSDGFGENECSFVRAFSNPPKEYVARKK